MAELARRCEFNADQLRQWRHQHDGRRPSPASCAALERGTRGLCTCEELRPDIPWRREPDPEWEWHPKGRPLVDVTRTAEAA